MTAPDCPICGAGSPTLLGQLGRFVWFRCRDCGMEYYDKAETPEKEGTDA